MTLCSPCILVAIVENLLVRVTMGPGFVHPCPGTQSVPTWTPTHGSINIVIQKCLALYRKHSAPALMMLALKSVYVNCLHGRTQEYMNCYCLLKIFGGGPF